MYELLVRTNIVSEGSRPAGKLHKAAIEFVSAKGQAKAMETILPLLDETERAVFQRGRNAGSVRPPKNADPNEYHIATGLEALFGYLYLSEKNDRIHQLFEIVCPTEEK